MQLFQLKNYKLEIQPEAYSLTPFKKIWDRDKSKDKDVALKELAYVFFMCDFKSDFSNILDEIERSIEVIKYTDLNKSWKPDKIVLDAVEFYRERNRSVALQLLEDARNGISKLSTYIRDINFNEVEINEKTGDIKPKHDIKKYADTIKQVPAILAALKELEDEVKKEMDAGNTLRAGRKKGMYVD